MNLIIDQGNTNLKLFFFENDKIIEKKISPFLNFDVSMVNENIENVIYSTVSGVNNDILKYFSNKIFIFNSNTPLPIKNMYKSKTIGLDRLAGVVGASEIYNNSNVLVIDIGSAITYDLITKNKEFLGGNISPGINLRFSSLNTNTKNLPLLQYKNIDFLLGNTTNDAILGGVINGILFEIESYISRLSQLYDNLKIILTGGDAEIFVKKINNTIFAEPNLVAIGLNNILKYNLQLNY